MPPKPCPGDPRKAGISLFIQPPRALLTLALAHTTCPEEARATQGRGLWWGVSRAGPLRDAPPNSYFGNLWTTFPCMTQVGAVQVGGVPGPLVCS